MDKSRLVERSLKVEALTSVSDSCVYFVRADGKINPMFAWMEIQYEYALKFVGREVRLFEFQKQESRYKSLGVG